MQDNTDLQNTADALELLGKLSKPPQSIPILVLMWLVAKPVKVSEIKLVYGWSRPTITDALSKLVAELLVIRSTHYHPQYLLNETSVPYANLTQCIKVLDIGPRRSILTIDNIDDKLTSTSRDGCIKVLDIEPAPIPEEIVIYLTEAGAFPNTHRTIVESLGPDLKKIKSYFDRLEPALAYYRIKMGIAADLPVPGSRAVKDNDHRRYSRGVVGDIVSARREEQLELEIAPAVITPELPADLKHDLNFHPSKVWDMIKSQLKLDMHYSTYQEHIDHSFVLAYAPGMITIGTLSEYSQQWLEARLTSTVVRLLAGITGSSIEMEFKYYEQI